MDQSPWCLLFREDLYGPLALKIRQNISPEIDWHWSMEGSSQRRLEKPAKSKRGREEGDGTENVINCRDVCRKLS